MSGGIKYYQLKTGEDLPSEFCAVRDEDGEPSEYTFYVPESENDELRELLQRTWDVSQNDDPLESVNVRNELSELEIDAKLRELARDMYAALAVEFAEKTGALPDQSWGWYDRMRELGIEVDEC